jgi:glycerate kinase
VRILLAPNPFKGTLSAAEAAAAIQGALQPQYPSAQFDCMPLADGGPGSLEALQAALPSKLMRCRVLDPWGRLVTARWLRLSKGEAFIESAEAVGLKWRRGAMDSPLSASSFGLGQLMRQAFNQGVRTLWIGLGGTATTDAGLGMAMGLGGLKLPRGSRIRVLCDVKNPLFGKRGAAYVFAPQKGASLREVKILEQRLRDLARLMPARIPQKAGAGAAGGLGAGLMAWTGASLVPGAQELLKLCNFEKRLQKADFVISGEGRLDAQSLGGKLPVVIAKEALGAQKPCLLVCGQIESGLKLPGAHLCLLKNLSSFRAKARGAWA